MFNRLLSIGLLTAIFSLSIKAFASEDSVCLLGTHCLSDADKISDFNEIVSKIRHFYGPLKFKERTYNFTLDQVAEDIQSELLETKSDAEVLSLYRKFLAQLRDAHISYNAGIFDSILTCKIVPIAVLTIENKYFISGLGKELAGEGVGVGDEIIAIDGEEPHEVMQKILVYRNVGQNKTNVQLNAGNLFFRPYDMSGVFPAKNSVRVCLKHRETNAIYEHVFLWRSITKNQAMEALGSITGFPPPYLSGNKNSFFITKETRAAFKFKTASYRNDEMNESNAQQSHYNAGILLRESDIVPAHLYRFKGKYILLIRQNTYGTANGHTQFINYYRSLLREFEDLADILVIDQTNNPGGSMEYGLDFFRLFIANQAKNIVLKVNNDITWLQTLMTWRSQTEQGERYQNMAHTIMKAIVAQKNGLPVQDSYFPLFGNEYLNRDEEYTWQKPILVLVNEMSASTADIVPHLFKVNGRAKIFGETTMGAGGNVESVVNSYNLPHTGISISMTRSLFTAFREDGNYTDEDIIENRGVSPDVVYTLKSSDLNDGFVNYVTAFSNEAVAILSEPSK